ncbi:MAG: MBL fold metallo-hydrolase [Candidatus Bathyarchaeia archaeon]
MTELGWAGGFTILTREGRLVFDPDSTRSCGQNCSVFISHAHADHFTGLRSKSPKYSTPQTRRIFECIHGKPVKNFYNIEFNKPIRVGDAEITPINAGHMLGSTQFLVTLPDETILYTGDINYTDTLTTVRAERAECDVLVMEATYGEPSYVFPDRESVYNSIVTWALSRIAQGTLPSFKVYAAGKAQELIRLFNTFTNLEVITDKRISKISEVYSASGYQMRHRELNVTRDRSPSIYLTADSKTFSSEEYARAVTTGWALRMNAKSFAAFPLSSHADFSQLLQFIKDCRAKKVYIFTGYMDVFADYVRRKLGVASRPLPALPQKTLCSFH